MGIRIHLAEGSTGMNLQDLITHLEKLSDESPQGAETWVEDRRWQLLSPDSIILDDSSGEIVVSFIL